MNAKCARCGTTATVKARAETLCQECFVNYVKTKVIKKMETFRVRNTSAGARRRLLLPLSFGASSFTLLHILDQHLERQVSRTGRAGFDLHVLHVKQTEDVAVDDRLESLRSLLPRHEYSAVDLFAENEDETADDTDSSPPVQLENISSATSRSDLLNIQLSKRVARTAARLDCESVLWGHSTTALAEKVIAETSKGRGFALPSLIQDGPSPFGVNFMYPMRDLLRKEIVEFAKTIDSALTEMIRQPPTRKTQISSKVATIDSLMKDYFESVEESYPSIVANVVRTSGKLGNGNATNLAKCFVCNMPLPVEKEDYAGWAGNQEAPVETTRADTSPSLCYGCARSFPHLQSGQKAESD